MIKLNCIQLIYWLHDDGYSWRKAYETSMWFKDNGATLWRDPFAGFFTSTGGIEFTFKNADFLYFVKCNEEALVYADTQPD